ncbi:hypothetical protein PV08_08456 [Exophiala spinifera]|uniref:Cupin type-1 domain-containing protein n=1 Tax=Exophiala spinifera TaxID=91928 RepID=A0A0D2BQ65_9EURO|nr:uncharacterized protein PV08_08456 [Exophiala spinifera]KIW13269.1 hypothetical protein PV08_08456 [Exophiala spinifera]
MAIPRTVSLISLISLLVPVLATAVNAAASNGDGSRVAEHQRALDYSGHGGNGHGLGEDEREEHEREKKLRLSAVLNEPDPPYHAIVQCWELSPWFVSYPTTGRALSLGDTANATYVVLPPRGGEGWHRPPSPMFFVLLSGLAHVKTYPPALPGLAAERDQHPSQNQDVEGGGHDDDDDDDEPTESLFVVSGVNPLIIAVDTDLRSPGHLTFYPSEVETVALQVPFKDGRIPEHDVLYDGPCRR